MTPTNSCVFKMHFCQKWTHHIYSKKFKLFNEIVYVTTTTHSTRHVGLALFIKV